jgi:CRP/FNR family cyclic AMP-dependent transcriptional regulator
VKRKQDSLEMGWDQSKPAPASDFSRLTGYRCIFHHLKPEMEDTKTIPAEKVGMPLHIRQATDSCRNCSHRALRLFCNLGEDALSRFDQLGLHISFPSRAVIFEEFQQVTNVFVVCTGHVKLSATSREGRTMILRLAGPGDILGLSAALSNQCHEVTAETIEPTQLKSVRRVDFLSLLEDFSEVGEKAARVVALEYRAAYLDARRLAISGSAAAKLAQLLLEWANAGACNKQERRFTMTLTHEELANMCGVSRETITRLLNQFERDGLIDRRGVSMIIRDSSGLDRLAS